MSELGIYFGPKVISIVETKGKKLINNIQIPQLRLAAGDLEEKVPDEIKIVALFKDELRRNKISAQEATLSLSGQDLIIRTFEMPPFLPVDELQKNTINFEARKYIPFKVEDLISDFQLRFDKLSRRNIVLFMGIKKETMDKYQSIFSQLELKIKSLEYSAFGILRLLKLAGMSDKGIIGVMGADLEEQDEVNFIALEDGFPLFSHEINLTPLTQHLGSAAGIERNVILEKLKTEISLALDYYHRKFPAKAIKKLLCISQQNYRTDLEAFIKELGLSPIFIDIGSLTRYLGKSVPFSLSFIKGYSSSLSRVIKTTVRINLLTTKISAFKEIGMRIPFTGNLFAGLKVDRKIQVAALLICILFFIFGFYKNMSLKKQVNSIVVMRPAVSGVDPNVNYEELIKIEQQCKEKIKTLDNIVNKQLYLTDALEVIARLVPQGMWLTNLSFEKRDAKAILTLVGVAYSEDSEQELQMINQFLGNLKENPAFNKYFKQMKIVSVDQGQIKEASINNFTISCGN